jgi:hypothetical protein
MVDAAGLLTKANQCCELEVSIRPSSIKSFYSRDTTEPDSFKVHDAAVMLLIYFFVDIEHIAVVRFKNQT